MKKTKVVSLLLMAGLVLSITVTAMGVEGVVMFGSVNSSEAVLIGGPLDNNTLFSPYQAYNDAVDNSITNPQDDSYMPRIEKEPTSETKDIGDSTSFIARASFATGARWVAVEPTTHQEYSLEQASAMIQGVKLFITQKQEEYFESILHVWNITEDIAGWQFKTYFSNGTMEIPATNPVMVTVNIPEAALIPTLAPTPTPIPEPTATLFPVLSPDPSPVLPTSVSTVTVQTSFEERTERGITENSSVNDVSRSYLGLYILSATALLVILGAAAILTLYMKGKISLGIFEQVMNRDAEDEDDFFNPDDFKSTV